MSNGAKRETFYYGLRPLIVLWDVVSGGLQGNQSMVAAVRCLTLLLTTVFLLIAGFSSNALAQSTLSEGFAAQDQNYSPEARAGRDIWFNATAFNDRFFTYSYPQRLGAAIDWYGVLGAGKKQDIFQAWGGIPDPDCCVPGSPNCPAKSIDETYGFQWCPGDDKLLQFVGKLGYRDPACDFKDAPFDATTPHGSSDDRQSACDLRFGTSTGMLGLRKFPNPRFNKDAWTKLNGSSASWDKYRKFLSEDSSDADSRVNLLADGAMEPPFRIGMSCGACHIAYNPLKPPPNPNAPSWDNIDGLVGNQYSRISNLLASGMSQHKLEWQLVARARPGIVDTSALPMDFVANAGTMNAIINLAKRPLHDDQIMKWRKASQCPADPGDSCWCEPGKPEKCWLRSAQPERVANILKGGEDSIGTQEAIQRVYFNIGSCAEQCWLNHIPDMRAADPRQRNYGQTPFEIGQCRRDCASFRAIEDRLPDLEKFFLSARPTDLRVAWGLTSARDLEVKLENEFHSGAVEEGRKLYATNCASCHSSQLGPFENTDFLATDLNDPTLRADWLGNDKPVEASKIGTNAGRALHSNHMQSRVWAEYASQALQARAPDPQRKEVMKGGGRGYYRNISLLSAWAHAPFMHNNAIGPEICGKPSDLGNDFYSSPYVDASLKPLANPPPCLPFDPSVEGRYRLYVSSMRDMLSPTQRIKKIRLLDKTMILDIAPKLEIAGFETGLSLTIPKGVPAVAINSLRVKDIIQDVALIARDGTNRNADLEKKYTGLLTSAQIEELRTGLKTLLVKVVLSDQSEALNLLLQQDGVIQKYYSNLLDWQENGGHRFGESLTDQEKDALIAFVATL